MSLVEFLIIVGVTLAAEITDKTMVGTILISRYNGPAKTISAAVVAVGIEALVVALIAGTVRNLLKGPVISMIAGVILIAIGVLLVIKAVLNKEETEEVKESAMSWHKIAALYFVAELGDVTQATTASFALATGAPLLVALAATIGMGLSISAAVGLSRFTKHLPERVLYLVAGIVLVILGSLNLAGVVI